MSRTWRVEVEVERRPSLLLRSVLKASSGSSMERHSERTALGPAGSMGEQADQLRRTLHEHQPDVLVPTTDTMLVRLSVEAASQQDVDITVTELVEAALPRLRVTRIVVLQEIAVDEGILPTPEPLGPETGPTLSGPAAL
jgi:hypothetical protein